MKAMTSLYQLLHDFFDKGQIYKLLVTDLFEQV